MIVLTDSLRMEDKNNIAIYQDAEGALNVSVRFAARTHKHFLLVQKGSLDETKIMTKINKL